MKNDNTSIDSKMGLIKMLTQRQIEERANKISFSKRNSGLKAITFFIAFTL